MQHYDPFFEGPKVSPAPQTHEAVETAINLSCGVLSNYNDVDRCMSEVQDFDEHSDFMTLFDEEGNGASISPANSLDPKNMNIAPMSHGAFMSDMGELAPPYSGLDGTEVMPKLITSFKNKFKGNNKRGKSRDMTQDLSGMRSKSPTTSVKSTIERMRKFTIGSNKKGKKGSENLSVKPRKSSSIAKSKLSSSLSSSKS